MHKSQQKEDRMLLFHTDDRLHYKLMDELKVDEQYVRDGIKVIMEWYESQPHLPKYALDWDFVEGFFANCKFSIEKTKQKLDAYFSIRSALPEFFHPRDPTSELIMLANSFTTCAQMPKTTPEGYRVAHIKFSTLDTKLYDPIEGFKILLMSTDVRYFLDQSNSEILLFDCSNVKFGHASKITPTVAKRISFIFQNAYTHRLNAIHAFNINKYALTCAQLCKSLLSKKLGDRIHFHDNHEGLHKFIPKECLANELGGTAGDYDELLENYFKVINSDRWRQWYIRSGEEKTDESKRPEKIHIYDEFYGVTGTFRKLTLD